MRVRVLHFGVIRELIASGERTLDLPEGATVEGLLSRYRASLPDLQELWKAIAVAVNCEYALPARILKEGDEVALLPPVSGGLTPGRPLISADSAKPAQPNIALVFDPIDGSRLIAELKQGQDGAVVVFDGIVRNNTRGRKTLYLIYEAYEAMALRSMESLAAAAIANYQVRDIVIVHRLGKLAVGESSVYIAVASAHRGAAFEACRWLIDTLKKQVPIWKKEHFEDGAVWADGEPFPPDVTGEALARS